MFQRYAICSCVLHLLVSAICLSVTHAADNSSPATLSGQWFLSYQHGDEGDTRASRFEVNRGYITIKKRLSERITGRITPDISVDREGDGEGDLEMRLKYCYIDVAFDDLWILTAPHVEFGLVHRPWLGYEENIFRYRVQGSMFMERNGIFNSADFGFLASALLGGEIDPAFQDGVNSRVPGRWGSIAIGVTNGGGYHAIEVNENKSFESRVTIRPFPDYLPGLQVSYTGVVGKGNTVSTPDWMVNGMHVSYENRLISTAGQYYSGEGDYKGSKVTGTGAPIEMTGYSMFGELHLPEQPWCLVGRYDWFDDRPDTDSENLERFIAGVSWWLAGSTRALIDYDIATRDSWSDPEEAYTKFSVEYVF